MKKTIVVIVLILCVFLASVASAETFDLSVFQNNDRYEVEYDDMDDSMEINPVDMVTVMGIFGDNDDGLLLGYIDIKGIDGYQPILRITLIYSGEDWTFIDKVILKPAETRYTFEVERDSDIDDGRIYEFVTLVMTDESIGLLQDVIAGNSVVKIRLDGERDIDGELYFIGDVETIYNDYVAAGGLTGNFSLFKIAFPCEVKVVR